MDRQLSRAQVVDLLSYRRDTRPERDAPRPRLATISPFRPMSQRQLAHRERMLQHLAAATRPKNLTFDF
jgi:hypothetical protein